MGARLSVDDEDWWEEKPVSRHRAGIGGFFVATWAWFFFAALCAALACIGFFVPAKEGPMVGQVVGVIGGAGALACIAWGFVRWAAVVKHVDVHHGGVAWRDCGGEHRAAWDEIRDFYRTEILVNGAASARQVAIKAANRTEAVFTHALDGWKRMADRMQQETTARQLLPARALYEAGETIRFGQQVRVSRDGLAIQGKTIGWDRVSGVRVPNGYLVAGTYQAQPKSSSLMRSWIQRSTSWSMSAWILWVVG